jgi:hypothetical protein
MQILTAFKGHALIYREVAGLLSNLLDRDASAWRRLGRTAALVTEVLILSHLFLDDFRHMI